MNRTLPIYPEPGALAASRLRGLLALDASTAELLAVVSAMSPRDLRRHLGTAVAPVPWGCLVALRDGFGVVVTAGGAVTGFSGSEWVAAQRGLGLSEPLTPIATGWVAGLDNPDHVLGFAPGPVGAVGCLAVHGVHGHLSRVLPTPTGFGGFVQGPGGARINADEARSLAARTPAVWGFAAQLFGVELALDAFANGREVQVGAERVLRACYPGIEVTVGANAEDGIIVGRRRRYIPEIRFVHAGPDAGIEVLCWKESRIRP